MYNTNAVIDTFPINYRDVGPNEKLAKYFLEACATNPHSTATITGTHRLSYQQLQKVAVQIQSILKDAGVKQSQVVAICIPRSAALVAAVLGCVLHGAVFLLVDPSFPAQRMKVQFEISRPCALLYSTQDHLKIEPILRTCLAPIYGIGVEMEKDCISFPRTLHCSQNAVENFTCDRDVIFLIFTSGSTGVPKAACASASVTLNRFEWMWNEFPFQCNDVVCFKTSVNFVDCIWELLGTVLKGACLAIPLEEEAKDPRLLVEFMKKWKVTRVMFVPSYLRHVLEFTAASESLQFLTHCLSSGEPVTLSLAAMFFKAAPSCRFLNLYGTSEIWDVTYFEVTSQYLEKTSSSSVPIGKPIPNVDVQVIDPNTGEVISPNSSKEGELVTFDTCAAHLYLNSNDKSLAHPDSKRIFNTHDLVYYNSVGDLMYIGRRDHQVKVRGVRVNPSEIEAVIEKNSIVERAVVVADESHMNLIGFIQICENHRSSVESDSMIEYSGAYFFANSSCSKAIATELLLQLPQYLVPSLYVFTYRFPTLPSGKVSRKELPPVSEIRRLLSESVNETKPLSKTEEQLCSVIKSILQLDNVPLSVTFFALGGNSLSAVELASGIMETLHCSIPVSTIITSPTIQALAFAIDSEVAKHFMISACSDDNLDASIIDATGPLTFGQKGTLLTEAIANCDIYEIGVAAKCLQLINTSHLWKSIHNLAMNHESLRTLFPCTPYGKPFQKILNADSAECLSAIQLACSVVDCSKECPLRFINGQISLPELHFNLTEGPLWKFTLFTNVIIPGENEPCSIFAFQAHHIITDGWSMQQLLTDLEDTYMKYTTGIINEVKHQNPSKPYYAIQQAKQQHSMVYDKQLNFWKAKVQGATLPLFLHPKCIPSYTKNHDSFTIHRIFRTPLSEISSFCQANSITEFTLALTGLLVAIYALNGLQDIVAIIPNASRNPENMKISGLFDNCLPLRTEFGSTVNLHLLLQTVKEGVINMIENQIPALLLESECFKKGIILPNHPFFSGLFEQLLFVCDYKYSAAFSNSVLFQNIPIVHPSTDYVMELYVTVTMDNFDVQAVYSDQLYDASTVQVLLSTWESTIETMVKHVYLYVPLKLLCQDLYVSSCTIKHDKQILAAYCDNHQQSVIKPFDTNENGGALSLNCNEQITQQQLSTILQNLNAVSMGSHPIVNTNLSFSVFVIALMTATAKLNGEFSFLPSLTKVVEIVEGCANDTSIVVMDIRDQEHLLKSFPQANQSSIRFVSVQSLQSPISTHGAPLSQRATFGNTMEVCNNERNVKSRWLSDVKICSYLVTEHFSAVCRAAVLTSPQYTMLPLAVGLLLHGVSVDVFTIEYLDSFIQSVSKSGADLLVIPEITVPLILPKIVEHKLSIKHLWIQGLPLGLAYISNWMAASQHMQVIVTHSLMHERHLITHHLNLKDIPSIEDGSIPCIPIGRMCQGLNGKVLHRDGREVYQGFVGNFATVNDSQVHRSTYLVRQLPKDGSFELVSVNAEAYYKGIDVTPALFILSTIPEVSWCGVSQGIDKESTAILYSTPDVESSRHKIRETVLSYLSLSYLGIIYPLAINLPITPDFTLDLGKLSFSGHNSLLGPPMFSGHDADKDVDKIVRSVSKAFGIDSETVRQTSDFLVVGAMSTANILTLTVELNTEFNGGYIVSDVYQAVKDGRLIDLVRSRRQK